LFLSIIVLLLPLTVVAEEGKETEKEKSVSIDRRHFTINTLSLVVYTKKREALTRAFRVKGDFKKMSQVEDSVLAVALKKTKDEIEHFQVDPEMAFLTWSSEHDDEIEKNAGLVTFSFNSSQRVLDGKTLRAGVYLLMNALIQNEEIDPAFAISGSLSRHDATTAVEDNYYKIQRAINSRCRFVALPQGVEEELSRKVRLYGPEFLSEIEVYTYQSAEEVWGLCKKKKEAKFVAISGLFETVKKAMAKKDWQASAKDLLPALDGILKREPNHLSAQLIKKFINEEFNEPLSQEGSLEEILSAFQHLLIIASEPGKGNFEELKKEISHKNMTELDRELKKIYKQATLHEKAKPHLESAIDLAGLLQEYIEVNKNVTLSLSRVESKEKKSTSSKKKIQEELNDEKSTFRKKAAKDASRWKKVVTSGEKKVKSAELSYRKYKAKIEGRQRNNAQESGCGGNRNTGISKSDRKSIQKKLDGLNKLKKALNEAKTKLRTYEAMSQGKIRNPESAEVNSKIQKELKELQVKHKKLAQQLTAHWTPAWQGKIDLAKKIGDDIKKISKKNRWQLKSRWALFK
jgi:hypothetical protein